MTQNDAVSDEMLMALADGELNDLEAARLRQRLAADPALAARHQEFVRTRAVMQEAFPQEPVPERLVAAVLNGPDGTGRSADVIPMRRDFVRPAGWGMALAASVVLGLGGYWAGRSTVPGQTQGGDVAVATAAVPTGGEARLADGSSARVLASYATEIGLCRMIAQESWRHVICRDDRSGTWDIALSVHSGESGSFLPSSATAVELIDRLLDEIAAGPPMTADEERRALFD